VEYAIFPHPLDRYRLIQRIARLARVTFKARRGGREDDLQAVIARRASVSPTIIANIENLERCVADPARKPSRERFLKVLSWGLELPRDEIEALLWLFGEGALTERDTKHYLGYLTDAERGAATDLTPAGLRRIVLRQIRAIIDHALPDSGSHTAAMQVYMATASGRLAAERKLLELERHPGQRLRSAQLPSLINFPPEIHDDPAFVDRLLAQDTSAMTAAQQRQGREIFRERMAAFADNLRVYGGRTIIEKPSLVWYLTAREGAEVASPARPPLGTCRRLAAPARSPPLPGRARGGGGGVRTRDQPEDDRAGDVALGRSPRTLGGQPRVGAALLRLRRPDDRPPVLPRLRARLGRDRRGRSRQRDGARKTPHRDRRGQSGPPGR